MLTTLSRWGSWVQIPSGCWILRNEARYANWPSGQAQILVSAGSNPARAIGGDEDEEPSCVGWALASPGGCNPPAFGPWRFNSVPTHSLSLRQEDGPFGYRQATWFSARRGGFDSLTGYSTMWNDHSQAGGSPVGPHEADFPVRVRGLGLCGRAGARPSFISSEDGFDSHARNSCRLIGRVGKLAKPPAREAGACGFDSHSGHCPSHQRRPLVQRQAARLTSGRRGFDSLGDDSWFVRRSSMGGWSNGKTPGLQPGDRGSIPRPVHSLTFDGR